MKKICFILFYSGILISANGQNTIRPTIYFQDMNYYNPSAIPLDTLEDHRISVYGKYKIVENEDKIWNKPPSVFANYIGRIRKSNSFYTVSYINDIYSFYNRSTIYAGYTYQKKWGKSNVLSLGGRLVLNNDIINWTKLKIPHHETGKGIKFSPDLDLGIQYQIKGFTAGVSTKNVLGSSTKLEGEDLLKNWREAYFNVSYLFRIGKKVKVAPYALLYWERKLAIDGGLYLSLFNRVNVSYLLRVLELRSIYTLDVKIYKGLNVGLGFDHSKLLLDSNVDALIRYNF